VSTRLLARLDARVEAVLARAFGRLPIGWLQLSHSKTRLMAALAGVAFANVLVFVQLGIMGSLNGSVAMTYSPLRADLLVSASDTRTLTDGSPLARRLLWVARAQPGVAAAAPLYIGALDWTREDGSSAKLTVYGLPVEAQRFAGPALQDQLRALALRDTVLIDRRTPRRRSCFARQNKPRCDPDIRSQQAHADGHR